MRPESCQLLLIDMQERIAPSMHDLQRTVDTCRILLLASSECGVPVTVSEHCPEKLGATLPQLSEGSHSVTRIEKRSFGVLGSAEASSHIKALSMQQGRRHVVLAGIEAHVCVLHTALQLLEHGFEVSIVADAVTSRRGCDSQWALAELARRGVTVLPMESQVFGWMDSVDHAAFRALQRAIRDRVV